jgi:hypothetical protein
VRHVPDRRRVAAGTARPPEHASVADDLLVVNALLYMVACVLAYARMRAFARPARLAVSIDALFLAALALSIGIGAFIAWTLVP